MICKTVPCSIFLVSSVVTDVTQSATAMKSTPAMAADTTSDKRKHMQKLYKQCYQVTNMHLDICQK